MAQLTAAYDTLKMLYFKDFKEIPEERHMSPSFEKMAEALAPKNFNFFSGDNGEKPIKHSLFVPTRVVVIIDR